MTKQELCEWIDSIVDCAQDAGAWRKPEDDEILKELKARISDQTNAPES